MSGSLRDRFLPGLVSLVGPTILKTLGWTWKISRHGLDPFVERRSGNSQQRYIVALWHSELIPLAYTHRDERATVLVSRHRDGELLVRVAQGLGYQAVRGSTTRGAAAALRAMVRVAREGSGEIVLTPDGPKGPARRAQPGVAYVSALTGFPILPLASVARSSWRFRSWDRFGVPKPFTRIAVVAGDPIPVPREAARGDVGPWLRRYEEAMAKAGAEAARIVGAVDEHEAKAQVETDPPQEEPTEAGA